MPSKRVKLSELINPSPKQQEFLTAIENYKYVLYGGAKGGGKSYILRWALVKLLLLWAKAGHKGVRVALFCEDYPSLKDRQLSKVQLEFPDWLGKLADNNVQGMSFTLKPQYGGGIIAFRNLDDPAKYASSEFAAVAIDEMTKNNEIVFDQLRSIVRWPNISNTRIIGATNPGGIGHLWVKKRWIDRNFSENEPEPEQFHFIQAFAKDNPHLSPDYVRSLQGLPEALRKAYLDGSWDLVEGMYFTEWRNDIHVVEPYDIPSTWKKIRCIDHGRTAPTACLWGAIDYDGRIHWYREYYASGVDADVNAQKIAELSIGEKYVFTVIDSATFANTGFGVTISEIYQKNGVWAEPAPKERLAGWNLFHEYLRGDDGIPRMVFFKNCENAIRTIPALIHYSAEKGYSDKKIEDVDSRGEDHCADAISYALQYLHEGKSPKPKDALTIKLQTWNKKGKLNVHNLKKFYGRS